jgi:hypothetical protein
MLGRGKLQDVREGEVPYEANPVQKPDTAATTEEEPAISARGYEAIKDEVLREKLMRIGRKIAEEEKN